MRRNKFLILAAGAIAIFTASITTPVDASEIPLTKENKKIIDTVVRQIQQRGEYVSDIEQYGLRDYGTDLRTAGWKGDCEDWAIAFKNAIDEALPGYKSALKVMLVKMWNPEKLQDEDHAALFIHTDKRTVVVEGPAYSKTGKIFTRPKDVRATQYSKERIVGEIRYDHPTRLTLVDGGPTNTAPAAE